MRFYKLIKNDIINGFSTNFIHYLALVLIVLISCVDLVFRINGSYMYDEIKHDITFADFLLYLFCGMPKFVPAKTEAFVFPIRWFLLHMVLLYGGLYYPYRDLNTLGSSVLPRSGSRYKWWFSKCIWAIFNQLLSYLCIYVTLFVFCLLSGEELSLQITSMYINDIMKAESIFDSFSEDLLLIAVVLPFLVTMALCLLQMMLSLFVKPIFSYLVVAVILLASAYMDNLILIGNFAMPIRSCHVIENGYRMQEGCVIVLIIACMAVVIGLLRFRRYDIMSQEL